jgi:predicted PurR-regulated permease PerM
MTEKSKEASSAPSAALSAPASIRAAGQVSWAIMGILIVSGVFLAGFIYTKSVSIPIVLAVVLAIVFQPAVDWLANKGMSRAPAAAVVLIGLLVAIVGIAALVAGTLVANWDEISSDLSDAVSKIDDHLSNTSLSSTLGSQASDSAGSAGSTMMSGVGSGVSSVANSTIGVIGGLFFGLWVAFYVLQGTYLEDDESKKLPKGSWQAKRRELADYSRNSIRGYYTSQTVLGAFDGVLIALPMVLLGIPGAISVAIVNLVGSYIPYIGAFVGGGLAVLLALAHGGTSQAFIMLVVVILVQNTLENIIQPKITARYVSLSPLAVLLATALGGVIAGIVGLVLAVPLAAVGKEAVRIARRPDVVSTTAASASHTDDTS